MPRASAVTVAAHQSTQKNAGMAQAAAPLPNRLKVDLMNAIAFRPQARSARRLRGFTLIEIMVVITILGILAALIVPRVVGRTDDARIAAARQDIAQIMGALKLYRLDNGRYPSTEQGLRALVEKPTAEPLPTNWKQGHPTQGPMGPRLPIPESGAARRDRRVQLRSRRPVGRRGTGRRNRLLVAVDGSRPGATRWPPAAACPATAWRPRRAASRCWKCCW
jgi:type II secretion system protein G